MRIVHVAAGAGGMYCGACARDLNLARGLRALGHDVELLPLYTPLRGDDAAEAPAGPIFYSGISVFLRQASVLFRRMPRFLERALGSPALLEAASRFAIEVRADRLGPMTVSVLAGREGRQAADLGHLLDYLESTAPADVVSLTNSLLSGIAPEMKRRLGKPVVCSLQGEDSFLGALPEPYRSQALDLLRRNARAVDRFVAPSAAYAREMGELLQVPATRIGVVPPGTDAAAYRHEGSPHPAPFTIGYLSVIVPAKGLDLLADAFTVLVKERGREARLAVAGKVLNRGFYARVHRRLAGAGLLDRVDFVGEVDFAGKLEFLRRCHAFCVPTRIREARGMVFLEALAAGLPVVAPEAGILPEVLAQTGGGVLARLDAQALADALEGLMGDPEARERMGRSGAEGVARNYSVAGMAGALLEQMQQVTAGPAAAR